MISTRQKLGGVLFALIGVGGTIYIWYDAIHNGLLSESPSVLFPACVVLGIAMLLFRNYKEERLARGEDITGLPVWKLLTPPWRGALIVALVLGFGNYLVLRLSFDWVEK